MSEKVHVQIMWAYFPSFHGWFKNQNLTPTLLHQLICDQTLKDQLCINFRSNQVLLVIVTMVWKWALFVNSYWGLRTHEKGCKFRNIFNRKNKNVGANKNAKFKSSRCMFRIFPCNFRKPTSVNGLEKLSKLKTEEGKFKEFQYVSLTS